MRLPIVILGGGAAGIFAAIICAEKNPHSKILLLEKTLHLLTKVRISGGGRCNVTHACFTPKDLVKNYPRGPKELLGPFYTFGPTEIIDWFQKRGVALKTENDGRIFPTTDNSQTIIDCLLSEIEKLQIEICLQHSLQEIKKEHDIFHLHLKNGTILKAAKVLLATGSSKQGYTLASSLGHSLVEPVPSLFTFNTPNSPLLDLSGITISNVKLKLKSRNEQSGPLLLTHWGFSGPAALKLSAWEARYLHSINYETDLIVNWIPEHNQDEIFKTLYYLKVTYPSQFFSSENPFHLPRNLWKRLIDKEGLTKRFAEISQKDLRLFSQKLQADPFPISGKTTYKEEFVTCGGIPLNEVNFKTMESKICPGLFFAGEILDIDGITGGFNFQNAWTTGFLAGNNLLKKR